MRNGLRLLLAMLCALSVLPATASASSPSDVYDQWMPSPKNATWTYGWNDSEYSKTVTKEKYTVSALSGPKFTLTWLTSGLGNAPSQSTSRGTVEYQRTSNGTLNTNWTGTTPPSSFPILCATSSNCGNSVASSHFLLIWGTRSPVVPEPLVRGTEWTTTGGTSDDVTSDNRYVGRELVRTPAFPGGVMASKVESDITQAGAIGDPYGSGERTVWWVRGVGPVLIVFRHVGGEVSSAALHSTNLRPLAAPSDTNYLPLRKGATARFSYRNSKHLKKASIQKVTTSEVVNNTARLDVASVKGPIKLAGSYLFSSRLTGVANVSGLTKAASLAKFPALGPRSAPKSKRRHFFTPLDLMAYGYNPILPAYPKAGDRWASNRESRDFKVFGVTGSSRILGVQRVKTPAGTFRALAVRSTLRQAGFKYGSGTRTSYFAPNKGLVKLVFRHLDGSTSTVERLR